MSTITEDLATELSKTHNVKVVTSRPCRPYGYDLPSETTKDSWSFERIILDSYTHPRSDNWGRMKENISFGKAARKYISKHHKEIDVIYMNVFPLFAQKMVIKEAKKHGIRTINHIEDIYPEPFKQKIGLIGNLIYHLLLPMDKWNIKNATHSIVIGDKIKEYFIRTRKTDNRNISVVYNWQDETRFLKPVTTHPKQDCFTFMYVGSISRAAGLQVVIEAFSKAQINGARLIMAGSGNECANLKAECDKNNYKNIDFIDAPFEHISEIQAQADVLILPLLKGVSLRAVPSKLTAYLFSKKAIIACVDAESDVANIITKGECGWITSPENIDALKETMLYVSQCTNSDLIKMGNNAYKYVQEHLSRKVNLEKLVNLVVNSIK
ncbi:MAG: glycosyltransferase family 4 protein [Alistipes sp.]|nr:glycosyltransferase family 4 protein [Alistipes sp.]